MRNYIVLTLLIAFLLLCKKAISQSEFKQTFQERIPLDSIYAGKTLEYSYAIQFEWNQLDKEKLVLVYLDKEINFNLDIFESKNHKFIKKITKKFQNNITLSPDHERISSFFHEINTIEFYGTTIWIHYDARFLTKIILNNTYDEIIEIPHYDLRDKMYHAFTYLFSDVKNRNNFIGLLPSYYEVCPKENEYTPCVYFLDSSFSYAHKKKCIPDFDKEFWKYMQYKPIKKHLNDLYLISPLTHKLSHFDLKDSVFKPINISGIGIFENNIDSLKKIRKTVFDYSKASQMRNVYPMHFYYRIVGVSDNSLYLFREFWRIVDSTRNVSYYIDKIKKVDDNNWELVSTLDFSKVYFMPPNINVPSSAYIWSIRSILLSPIQMNDKYFARTFIEAEHFKYSEMLDYKTLLFEIYQTE